MAVKMASLLVVMLAVRLVWSWDGLTANKSVGYLVELRVAQRVETRVEELVGTKVVQSAGQSVDCWAQLKEAKLVVHWVVKKAGK